MVNWAIPFLLAACLVFGIGASNIQVAILGDSGLVSKTLGFVQNLPGFYIAALAAIATFQNSDMTKPMPGVPPTGIIVHNGEESRQPFTRRLFLSSMFAYLTALSIILTVFGIAILALGDPIRTELAEWLRRPAKAALAFVFIGLAAQLLTVTMWGIYYLGERLHIPD